MLDKMPNKLFKCQLRSEHSLGKQLLQHYQVAGIFDHEIGRYACDINLKTSFDDVLNLIKNNDVHFDLEVK